MVGDSETQFSLCYKATCNPHQAQASSTIRGWPVNPFQASVSLYFADFVRRLSTHRKNPKEP